ncbi:hypothetical protein CPB97_002798 [Podila verticillata]|nr:hypothetical protein CPB97_002798 [Podila verticillata]
MSDVEMEDIEIAPRQLSDRQMTVLVSLWRLSHYKQAPWSSWSILYSRRRPKNRARSPMICFDTATYEMLRKQQEEELKARQLHQHQIWQHVQDRLAEQNRLVEEEEKQQRKGENSNGKKNKKSAAASASNGSSSSSTVGSDGSISPEFSPTKPKRSIRWGLQNNMIKKFDKTQPITLVNVPAVDKRPTKSALKIRTHHSANNPRPKPTDTKANTNGIPARKHAVDFF